MIAAILPSLSILGGSGTPLNAFIVPLTVTHYILSVPYSKKQISEVLKKRDSTVKLLVLFALAIYCSNVKIDNFLLYIFGFHYVFSEVYLFHQRFFGQLQSQLKLLRISSICFNLTVYYAVQKGPFHSFPLGHILLTAAMVASAIGVCVCLFRLRGTLTRTQLATCLSFESFSLVLLAVAHFVGPIPLITFVFYHVLFWFSYPSYCFWQQGKYRHLAVYLAQNAVLATALMLISPGLGLPFHLSPEQYGYLFLAGSIIHILTTLSLSTAQPAFLTRFFNSTLAQETSKPGLLTTSRPAVSAK
jgi:hypothetical protein